jgi:DNA-binding CsgD family transcriptional regulator
MIGDLTHSKRQPPAALSDLGHRDAATLADPWFESLVLRLHATIDIDGFWDAVRATLDEAVPNDACVVYREFTDFSRTWHAANILMTPRARKSGEWLQRRREVDMMTAFILAHPNAKHCTLTDAVPDMRRLRRSEYFRLYMAPDKWQFIASWLFWREDGLATEIAIRRTAEQGDFTSREMALLDRLHPHVETTLRRLTALQQSKGPALVKDESDDAIDRSSRAAPVHAFMFRLTPAERTLMHRVCEGWSNKEIAHQLGKSIRTVKAQLTSVYRKLGVTGRSRMLAMLR